MTHYRDLNKELVEQVQEMRKNNKLYCDEIINLKAELFHKRESEVALRKKCYNWALNNFLQIIQYVQPDSDILSVLEDHIESQERISNSSLYSSERQAYGRLEISSEKSPQTSRRSSLLTMELQRSNLLINKRKSVCSTSPIRKSVSIEAGDENDVEENEQQGNEEVENDLLRTELSQQPTSIDEIIYEESDEDEVENIDVESICESVEEISFTTQTRSSLKDITNILTEPEYYPEIKNIPSKTPRKRGRPKKTTATCLNNQKNNPDDHTSPIKRDKNSTKTSEETIKAKQQPTIIVSSVLDVEETFQLPRRYTAANRASDTNKSIPISKNINHWQNEENWNSSAFMERTIKNIKYAACSTPNTTHSSLKITTPVTNYESTTELGLSVPSNNTNNGNSRPSRKCKPTHLAEPKLGTKLRNETEIKKEPRSRSKSKTSK